MVNVNFIFSDGTDLRYGNLDIKQVKRAIELNIDQYCEELINIKIEW